MDEEKKGNGKLWELCFIMAAGPELVYLMPGEREAMEKAAAVRGRRDDWITLQPDARGDRLQFPRGYNTGIRIREHREATPPLAPPIVVPGPAAPAVAPDGAEAH